MEWKEATSILNSLQKNGMLVWTSRDLWSKLTNIQTSAFRMNIAIILMYVSTELSSLSKYSVKFSYPWIETLTPNCLIIQAQCPSKQPKMLAICLFLVHSQADSHPIFSAYTFTNCHMSCQYKY